LNTTVVDGTGPSPGFSSKGAKNQEGQKPEGGGTFLKYTIGYMQQPPTGGPNVKWGAPILNGGPGTTGPRWRRSWDSTVSYREFIPRPSYVRSKRTCSLASRALNTGE